MPMSSDGADVSRTPLDVEASARNSTASAESQSTAPQSAAPWEGEVAVARLAALERYGILDTAPEPEFDDVVMIASHVCEAPVALISLVVSDRQWFKAKVGFPLSETPITQSVCAYTLSHPDLLIIPDLTADPRTRDNTLVTGEPHIRSYVGAKLVTPEGIAIGALCVIDTKPRPAELTAAQARTLKALARHTIAQFERRQSQVFASAQDAASLEQELALDASRAERDRLWQLSTDLMLVADVEGKVIATNPAWTRVLGWDETDVVGRSCFEFVHSDDIPLTTHEMSRLSDGEATFKLENRYRCKDGTYRVLAWTAVPDKQGVYGIARDVTAERMAQAELAAAQDALRHSQKMEAVGQLTGGLAHDFNNLLTGVLGNLALARTRLADGRLADVDRYAVAAEGAAMRAAALTNRLLAFSRREALDPRPTDVNALIEGLVDLIQRTVGPEIAIERVMCAELWTTLTDPGLLENALLNLSINARDAMLDGGRLIIETRNEWVDDRAGRQVGAAAGEYVAVSVSDTGTGMAPAVVARAFEPFFTTKPTGAGSGLGLSMVYGFVQQSGGFARINSEVGKGTTVSIFLPKFCDPSFCNGVAAEPAAQAVALATGPGCAGQTVLIVDDELAVRTLMSEALRDLGYVPLEAGDSDDGLSVLRSGSSLDLMITDIGLPGGMNGRQLADAARAIRPGLKVLFITGYGTGDLRRPARLDPGTSLLTKPFTIDALAAQLTVLLGERGSRDHPGEAAGRPAASGSSGHGP